MRWRALFLAATVALCLAACDDGYTPVNGHPNQFLVTDADGESFDYGMAYRACRSVDKAVASVTRSPDDSDSGVVTCR